MPCKAAAPARGRLVGFSGDPNSENEAVDPISSAALSNDGCSQLIAAIDRVAPRPRSVRARNRRWGFDAACTTRARLGGSPTSRQERGTDGLPRGVVARNVERSRGRRRIFVPGRARDRTSSGTVQRGGRDCQGTLSGLGVSNRAAFAVCRGIRSNEGRCDVGEQGATHAGRPRRGVRLVRHAREAVVAALLVAGLAACGSIARAPRAARAARPKSRPA